jgi:hypothetical protein
MNTVSHKEYYLGGTAMKITRKSILTGIERTQDIDCTEEQFNAWQNSGVLIQNAFPNLSKDDREFILTGSSPEEWNKFKEEEEYDTAVISCKNNSLRWVITDFVLDADHDLQEDFKSNLHSAFEHILEAGFVIDPDEAGLTVELTHGLPTANNASHTEKVESDSRIVISNNGDPSVGINGCNYLITNVGNLNNENAKKDFLYKVIPHLRAAFECVEYDYVKIDVYQTLHITDSVSEDPSIYSHQRNQARIRP